MRRGFLAYVIPVRGGDSGAHPEHPIVLPPEGGGGDGGEHPAHPIVIPPGSIDGTHPEHPIYIPAPPHPEHPIFLPPGSIGDGKPEHPIYLPPVIWPDPDFPHPEHPIFIPDPDNPGIIKPPGDSNEEGGWGYSMRLGWVWVPAGGGGKPKPPSKPPSSGSGGDDRPHPDHTLPGQEPRPEHPIAPGGSSPGRRR